MLYTLSILITMGLVLRPKYMAINVLYRNINKQCLSTFLGRQTSQLLFFRCTLISSLTHVGSLDVMNGPEAIVEYIHNFALSLGYEILR